MNMISCAILLVLSLAGGNEPNLAGRLTLVAGGGQGGDGERAERASLTEPFGTAFDSDDTMFLVELSGGRVRKIGSGGILRTIAGTGRKAFGGDGGPAVKAEFNGMHSLATARNGDVIVADTWNNRVRRIDIRTGTIRTIAGTGHKGFSGDGGPATAAEFGGVYCVSLDPTREILYLTDLDNRRIRTLDLTTGIVTTIAGNGGKGVPVDGDDARSSPLIDPRAAAADNNGNVYILERSGHALRVVDRSGRIRTVAGTGEQGSSGDGGAALKAKLNGPKHLCVDAYGNVLIADTENHRIRVYRPSDGTIWNVAGTGRKGKGGLGGLAVEAELNLPHGVTIGPRGVVFICDSGNSRILKLEPGSEREKR